MIYNNEISQENNPNATARLYIQENDILYKEYFIFNDLTKKNIDNLLAIANMPQLKNIKELALPIDIIKKEDKVIGYTMPYYKGRILLDYINDNNISFSSKLSCFLQLANVIMQLPENIYIGDLHMKNVIVDDDGKIHLIDIDGFSLKGSHLLTCPLTKIIQQDNRFKQDKYVKNNSVIISRNTDILCFYDAFLYFIIGKIYFTMYSHKCFVDYLDYLEQILFPKELLDDILTLFSTEQNRITLSAFSKIDDKNIKRYSFKAYANYNKKYNL